MSDVALFVTSSCVCGSREEVSALLAPNDVHWRAARLNDAAAVDSVDGQMGRNVMFDAATLPQVGLCGRCGTGFAAANVATWLLKDVDAVTLAHARYSTGMFRGWFPPPPLEVGEFVICARVSAYLVPEFSWRVSLRPEKGATEPLELRSNSPSMAQRDELVELLLAHGRRAMETLRGMDRDGRDVDLSAQLVAAAAALR